MQYLPWPEQATFKIASTESSSYNHVGSSSRSIAGQETDRLLPNRKMAIPRLAEGPESAFSTPGRFHRRHVSRACESCRQRKTKCTGDKSGCRNCRDAGIICCYTDGKREKSKRQLASLESKIQTYEDVLKSLCCRFGFTNEQLMNVALTVGGPSGQALHFDMRTSFTEDQGLFCAFNAESPSFVDPTSCVDYVKEDFNKDETSQATGFIGQSSEISWIQALSRELNRGLEAARPGETMLPLSERDGSIISALNYHLDYQELPTIQRLDAFALPSKDMASKLYKLYVDWVHPSFPIIGITPFGPQFQAFIGNPSLRPGNKWLAILNLIFAIAARARVLSMDDRHLHHPDLQQLQVEGLAALYMLALGHINRAWKLCGSAVQGALGLGLHLRHMGEFTTDTSREARYRVWWSLYMIDHRLGMITGRPSCIDDNIHTTPLPVPFDESDFGKEEVIIQLKRLPRADPSNSGGAASPRLDPQAKHLITTKITDTVAIPSCGSLYFLHLIRLTLIARKMKVKLYNPGVARSPLIGVELAIQSLTSDIESWLSALPKDYDFTSMQSSQATQSIIHQRISLALFFYSTKMGITRPCLRRLSSVNPDGKFQDFCKRTAAECVESACHMLRLFPENLHAATLYKMSPWWCVLHFLMQATTILLLELAFGVQHVPEKVSMVSKAAEKAYEWLGILARTSMASEKARLLCDGFMRRIAQCAGGDTSNYLCAAHATGSSQLNDTPVPPSTTGARELLSAPDTPDYDMADVSLPPLEPSGSINAPPSTYQTPGNLDSMKIERDTPFQSPYDGGLPYDPSTGQIISSFFPPGAVLDFDVRDYLLEEF
ncbi:CeGAL family transcription factor [Aspergillus ibericus CBS 121593]|uniref:Fungal-specific transcription factor domain protein n=1 Tax=Aspergillus ibericus CBS 121593 TaxID=1448316 RepID=A0A395GJC9_9EURO|nr:fungal-specific transcription factor domain protein [Aspergillus ibericus CBS 121593]RAK95392.1 fungal-specific transcription factor domain protein [Aspergillus ibericus CBS 121593]